MLSRHNNVGVQTFTYLLLSLLLRKALSIQTEQEPMYSLNTSTFSVNTLALFSLNL